MDSRKAVAPKKGILGLMRMDFRTCFTCYTLSLIENSNEVFSEFSHLLGR